MKRKNNGCYFNSGMPDRKKAGRRQKQKGGPGHTNCIKKTTLPGAPLLFMPSPLETSLRMGPAFSCQAERSVYNLLCHLFVWKLVVLSVRVNSSNTMREFRTDGFRESAELD